jgi:O-antigen ligase
MPLRLAVILATSYFLYRTGSKTSMGVLVAAIGIGAIYSLYNPRYRALLLPGAMLAVASAILWIYLHIDQIVAPLYSQTALTGRVQIWAVQIGYAQDHPLLGAGYGSFWNIGETSPVYQYGRGWVRDLASGHNGYLDLLAQIGFPGLILALLAVFILPAARLFTSQTVRRSRGAMLLAMIVFGAGHNLTEASLMDRDTIVQLFLMFAVALVGVACSSRRLPGQIAMRAT